MYTCCTSRSKIEDGKTLSGEERLSTAPQPCEHAPLPLADILPPAVVLRPPRAPLRLGIHLAYLLHVHPDLEHRLLEERRQLRAACMEPAITSTRASGSSARKCRMDSARFSCIHKQSAARIRV